jgi:tetratricopeptide (TPR) repeat protein
MTLPRIDSEKKARLFNRANQYRLNNEFDKAYDAYKSIVEEDEQEAEGYWGMILSEYGIEYVEDPKSHKRIPTCHRTQIHPIQSTINYELACKYSDAERKFMYQDEAEVIDRLQKSILAVSSREEPYDVFICYKETDDLTGERTKDSVLAQEIYESLTEKGIRVFFSRITLEDKLGTDYEPYIYSALQSSRVMIVVTTSAINVNAVWVKNEWARFLNFQETDRAKTLIPVYSNEMSPYELPNELSKFQAQNMDKIGALQDLIRGIQKLLGKAQSSSDNAVINELLLERQEREANKRKRRKKLQVSLSVIGALVLIGGVFALGYQWYNSNVLIPGNSYNSAMAEMEAGNYAQALKQFNQYPEYKDTQDQIAACEELWKSEEYDKAKEYISGGMYDKGLSTLKEIIDYEDSYDLYMQVAPDRLKYLFENDVESAINLLGDVISIHKNDEDVSQICEIAYSYAQEDIELLKYKEAARLLSYLAECNYMDSVELASTIEEKASIASEKEAELQGVYKQSSGSRYIKFKKDNKIWATDNLDDLSKNFYCRDWSYAYDVDEECYYFFTHPSNSLRFKMTYDGSSLEIEGRFNASGKAVNSWSGKYTKESNVSQ